MADALARSGEAQDRGGLRVLASSSVNRGPENNEASTPPTSAGAFIGNSAALRAVVREVGTIARSGYRNVLIQGESGVGKELVALALQGGSRRRGKPFEIFDCPAVPEDHLESELFGTARGAFPGSVDRRGVLERADGGTIFLDEIGAMRPTHQAKVLRVMEGKSFRRLGGIRPIVCDVAFIAAAHQDLATLAATGQFRHDLYFRLIQDGVVAIPPLRERREDIPDLVFHCLRLQARARSNSSWAHAVEVRNGALRVLSQYHWPGNVRQLFSVVQMASRLDRGVVSEWAVTEAISRTEPRPMPTVESPRTSVEVSLDLAKCERSFESVVRETQRRLLVEAYRHSGGNKTKAGIALGFHLPAGTDESRLVAAEVSSAQKSLALRRFRYWSFRVGLSLKALV